MTTVYITTCIHFCYVYIFIFAGVTKYMYEEWKGDSGVCLRAVPFGRHPGKLLMQLAL